MIFDDNVCEKEHRNVLWNIKHVNMKVEAKCNA